MPLELSYRLCPKLSPSVASLLNDTSILQLSLENSTDHLLYSSCDSQVKDTILPWAHILQELPHSPHLRLLHTALQPGDLGPRDLSCRRSLQNTSSGPSWACYCSDPETMQNTVLQYCGDSSSRLQEQAVLIPSFQKNKAKRRRPLRSVQQRVGGLL